MSFQMKILETSPTMTKYTNPFNGVCNLRNRIKNIGAANAAIGRIHLPLKKKRQMNPKKR
jgi:hypothetical protein